MNASVYTCYVSGYTRERVGGISLAEIDVDAGEILSVQLVAGLENPSYIVRAGAFLLACIETDNFAEGGQGGQGGFAVLRVGAGGALAPVALVPSGGGFPCHVCFAPRSRLAFLANYGSGTVGCFYVSADGVPALQATLRHAGRGPRPEQGGPHAHCCVVDAAEETLYVCDLGVDRVMVYDLRGGPEHIVLKQSVCLPAGSGPRHLVLSLDGQRAYVLCEFSYEVYTLTLATGALSAPLALLPEAHGPNPSAAAIRLNRAGTQLAVSCRGEDALVFFGIDEVGGLYKQGYQPLRGSFPRDFAPCPQEESCLLVAFEKSNALGLLRKTEAGAQMIDDFVQVQSPTCVCWAGEAQGGQAGCV